VAEILAFALNIKTIKTIITIKTIKNYFTRHQSVFQIKIIAFEYKDITSFMTFIKKIIIKYFIIERVLTTKYYPLKLQ